jgi:hypothetical protein
MHTSFGVLAVMCSLKLFGQCRNVGCKIKYKVTTQHGLQAHHHFHDFMSLIVIFVNSILLCNKRKGTQACTNLGQ